MNSTINSSYAEQSITQLTFKMLVVVLVFEFGLLAVFVWRGLIPVMVTAGLVVFVALFYTLYRNSMYAVLLLMFSILPGPIAVMKVSGKTPPFLFLDIALFLAVIVMLTRWLVEWDGTIRVHPIAKSFLLFLCWGGITTLQAVDTLRAIMVMRNYFSGLVAFLLVYETLQTEKDVKKIYLALLLWSMVLSLMELYNLFQYGGLTLGIISVFFRKNLIATSWGMSNYLAAFDVLLIPIAMAVFFAKTPRYLKYFTISSLTLMTTALIISLSRGGLAACFVAMLIVLARSLRLRTFLSILAIVIVVSFIVLLNPLTFVLIERILTFEQSISFYSRISFWKETWRIFQEHPITGVGLGNLGYYATFMTVERSSAHNIVLGLLGETGIIGFILFAILIVRALHTVVHSLTIAKNDFMKQLAWGTLCSLFGILLHSMIEPNFEAYQFSVMVWTIIGLVAKLPYLASDETVFKVGP